MDTLYKHTFHTNLDMANICMAPICKPYKHLIRTGIEPAVRGTAIQSLSYCVGAVKTISYEKKNIIIIINTKAFVNYTVEYVNYIM